MMKNTHSTLKKYTQKTTIGDFNFSNQPEIKKKLNRQDSNLTVDDLVVNTSPQGKGKTLYQLCEADSDTIILVPSHDYIEEKLYPEEDWKIEFHKKFVWVMGFRRFVKERAENTSPVMEKSILDLAKKGVPSKFLKELLDSKDEAKYDKMIEEAKRKPCIAAHEQLMDSRIIDAKEHIVWEENPFKPMEDNLTMFFEDIYEKADEYDLLENFGAEDILKDVLDYYADNYRKNAKMYPEVNNNKLAKKESMIYKRHSLPTTQNEWVFEAFWEMVQDRIIQKINQNLPKNVHKVAELSKLRKNLLFLKEHHDSNLLLNANPKAQNNSGNAPSNCPSLFGETPSYLSHSRSFLDALRDQEQNVTINYAEAMPKLFPNQADFRKVMAKDPKISQYRHIRGGFNRQEVKSGSRGSQVKSLQKIHEELDKEVERVSYKGTQTGEIYWGNSRGKEAEADVLQVVGAPRLNDFDYHRYFYLHKKQFPDVGYFDRENNEVVIEDKETKDGTVSQLPEPLKPIYEHKVLRQKKDALSRVRNQDRDEDIIVENFGLSIDMFEKLWDSDKIEHYDYKEYLLSMGYDIARSGIDIDTLQFGHILWRHDLFSKSNNSGVTEVYRNTEGKIAEMELPKSKAAIVDKLDIKDDRVRNVAKKSDYLIYKGGTSPCVIDHK